MKVKNKTVRGDFNVDPHGVLYKKTQDHGNAFNALILPKVFQKLVLFESHNSIGYNSITESCQFLKRQCYWKGVKGAVQQFVRHCLICQKKQIYKLQIMCIFT